MFSMEFDVRQLWTSVQAVEKPPPVRITCKQRARIFIQSTVVFVLEKVGDEDGGEDSGPVFKKDREDVVEQHVE